MKRGRNNDRDVQIYVRNSPLCDGVPLLESVSFSARKMLGGADCDLRGRRMTNKCSTYDEQNNRPYPDDESSQVEWLVNVRRGLGSMEIWLHQDLDSGK